MVLASVYGVFIWGADATSARGGLRVACGSRVPGSMCREGAASANARRRMDDAVGRVTDEGTDEGTDERRDEGAAEVAGEGTEGVTGEVIDEGGRRATASRVCG